MLTLTPNITDGNAERCLEAGMDNFLAKPIRVEELQRELMRVSQHDRRIKPSDNQPETIIDALVEERVLRHCSIPGTHGYGGIGRSDRTGGYASQ